MPKRSKSKRGRPPKSTKSIIYRLTLTLDPVEHAPIVFLLNTAEEGKKAQAIIDALMSKAVVTFGKAHQSPPEEDFSETLDAEDEVSFGLDGF